MTPDEREAIIAELQTSRDHSVHSALAVIESLSEELKAIRLPVGTRNSRVIVEKWADDMHGRKPTWSEVNLCNRVAAALSADVELKFTTRAELVKALKDYLEASERGVLDLGAAKARFTELMENA